MWENKRRPISFYLVILFLFILVNVVGATLTITFLSPAYQGMWDTILEASLNFLSNLNAMLIAGLLGIGTVLIGILIAALMVWLSRLVTANQVALETAGSAINPSITFGHEIPVNSDLEEQLQAARREAARRAAMMPRGQNMRIGRLGAETLRPASKNLDDDPLSAVRIAAFHTWQGARTGPPVAGAPQAVAQAAAGQPVAVPTKSPDDLVPGVDYPFIEITDDMPPAEVRRARIANARAKAEAVKALQAAPAAAPAAPAPGQAVAPAAAAAPAAPAVSVPEPELIEITDDMSPDEVRQARIANAKAKAEYQKALKEAQAAAPAAPAAQPAAAAPPPVAAPAAPAVSVPEPELIEITDEMSADEVRQARIANAKAKAEYQKALNEAQAAAPAQPQPQAAPQPAAQPPAAPAGDGNGAALASIPRPELIEITDDMSPDEVRSARIANAKAKAEYQKALKEAGIDPSTVSLE